MDPVLVSVATAVLKAAAGAAGSHAIKAGITKVRPDPEEKADKEALATAIGAAHTEARKKHGEAFRGLDINIDAFEHEAAPVLARLLCGERPTAQQLANALIDGLSPTIDLDTRWNRIDLLYPPCAVFLTTLESELRKHKPFQRRLPDTAGDLQTPATTTSGGSPSSSGRWERRESAPSPTWSCR